MSASIYPDLAKKTSAPVDETPSPGREFLCSVREILFRGFEPSSFVGFVDDGTPPSITVEHFNPWTKWMVVSYKLNTLREPQAYLHPDEGNPLLNALLYDRIYDSVTKEDYLNDSPTTKRIKCLLLVDFTWMSSFGMLLVLINRLVKIVSFSHFWYKNENGAPLENRCIEWIKDVGRIALLPFILVGLQAAAIYGLVSPRNGGKLYATLERCAFGRSFLAPCFQPRPTHHFFGGDINKRDQY